jgi:cytochrome c2
MRGAIAMRPGPALARGRCLLVVVVAAAVVCSGGCSSRRDLERVAGELTGGEPARGAQQIRNYGCDSCHTIPVVLTADATVGPPLTQIGRRTYLAGRIENTPENMIRWIRRPTSVDEKTAMPDTGVTERDARDIAAYLYTLR